MLDSISAILPYVVLFGTAIPSIVFHEVAHGYAALALGDETAKVRKRLSLNPIEHVDPFGTLLMPALLALLRLPVFGYAKPVPINPNNFRGDQAWGMFLTAAAGPGTNLALATIGALLVRIVVPLRAAAVAGATSMDLITTLSILLLVLTTLVEGNLVLMFFNLIPVPPLDGSRVLPLILPKSARPFLYGIERYGLLVVIAALWVLPMLIGFSPIEWYFEHTMVPLFQVLTGLRFTGF